MLGGGTVVADATQQTAQQAAKTALLALREALECRIPGILSAPGELGSREEPLWQASFGGSVNSMSTFLRGLRAKRWRILAGTHVAFLR